ncbi:MAG: hypothetical protein LC118_05875 [Dehalococcoidia bacterium]|nr:hypothetical protein [Dehalococcoidia bacterium]
MAFASVGSVVAVQTTTTALAIARPTRRSITFYNDDGSNPVYIMGSTPGVAAAAATTSHFKLKAGASITLTGVGDFNAIATGSAVNVYIMDEYD